jgi:hypothetical protein
MPANHPIYYFTCNKMDMFLKELTHFHPQTPIWNNALQDLHQTMRAALKPPQDQPSNNVVLSIFSQDLADQPAKANTGTSYLTLEKLKSHPDHQGIMLDRTILMPLRKKDLPRSNTVQNLQKTSFLVQHYRLATPDCHFDVKRLAMLGGDPNQKRIIPLDAYAVQASQQSQPEKLIRFMRAHSPSSDTYPSLSGFREPHKALLQYYVLSLK